MSDAKAIVDKLWNGQLRQADPPLLDAFGITSRRSEVLGLGRRIRLAAASRPFYYYYRAEQRCMVLERLEESYGHKELSELSKLSLSVEHILPQTLSSEWIAELTEAEDDADAVHRELVHTLGNLTLSAYNSELSNMPFERSSRSTAQAICR